MPDGSLSPMAGRTESLDALVAGKAGAVDQSLVDTLSAMGDDAK